MNKDIKSRNSKGQKHGLWEMYWGDNTYYKGFFNNGKLVGYNEHNYRLFGGKITIKKCNI